MPILPAFALVLTAFVALVAAPAQAQQPTIGIIAPMSGSIVRLGDQMRVGAIKAAESAGLRAIVRDDKCDASGGEAAAKQMVAAKIDIVVGFLCTDAIESALPILTDANIPVITPGVRTDALTDRRAKTGWLVFRTAPRADAERGAIADLLTRRWSDKLFAIVDDGTIYGRELAESFRLATEQAGLQVVFTDTYRPQFDNQIGLAGRLKGAGATHVFAGGNRDDVAILARDAAVIGYPLVIAGGEALRAATGDIDLAPGTLMVGLPEAADIASEAFLKTFQNEGISPEGYLLGGYAAVQIAVQALEQRSGSEESLTEILASGRFETEAGAIRFDAKGDRTGQLYRLFRYDGQRFVEAP